MEKRAASRERLVAAATGAFGRDGFDAVSLDDIVAEAGVTKGSLYHHFASKRDLFEAVFRRELDREVALFEAAYAVSTGDSWDAFRAASFAYIDSIMDPMARRIAIVDAPAVLGVRRVREIEDTQCIGFIRQGVAAAMRAGRLRERPVEPVANLIFAALCEAASQLGRADDLARTHAEWTAELDRFFDSLA